MRIVAGDKPPSTQKIVQKPTVHLQRIGATLEPKTDQPSKKKCVTGRRANQGKISP
ncbi:unnamed protein product [Brassica rapa]|uniref:Uncharacterized protein n=1 Tax=Brassica campestris TaxID=3711 RepID=A0A8D9GNQ2_BRACM|nr:unnamed protein product [Brassica rapa]